jgi:hypothetical protein
MGVIPEGLVVSIALRPDFFRIVGSLERTRAFEMAFNAGLQTTA